MPAAAMESACWPANQPGTLPPHSTPSQEGMFRDPPADLQLGTRLPEVGSQLLGSC